MPAAGLAVPCTVVPFLVVVVPAGDKLDFVFSETGESHEFGFGCFRPHSRFVCEYDCYDLGNQFSRIEQLVNVICVCAARLFSIFNDHPVQHILSLVAHMPNIRPKTTVMAARIIIDCLNASPLKLNP